MNSLKFIVKLWDRFMVVGELKSSPVILRIISWALFYCTSYLEWTLKYWRRLSIKIRKRENMIKRLNLPCSWQRNRYIVLKKWCRTRAELNDRRPAALPQRPAMQPQGKPSRSTLNRSFKVNEIVDLFINPFINLFLFKYVVQCFRIYLLKVSINNFTM